MTFWRLDEHGRIKPPPPVPIDWVYVAFRVAETIALGGFGWFIVTRK